MNTIRDVIRFLEQSSGSLAFSRDPDNPWTQFAMTVRNHHVKTVVPDKEVELSNLDVMEIALVEAARRLDHTIGS